MKTSVTLDTSVLLDILDHGPNSRFCKIMEQHDLGTIDVAISNRVNDPDTWKMRPGQREALRRLIADHKVTVCSAPFRLDISKLGGRDVLQGAGRKRSPGEVENFKRLVGNGPDTDSRSKKLKNQIGDYDALECHFLANRDVFVTLDKRGYFSQERRDRYKRELGLIIQSPEEFVAAL
jgi:hypothetical protein